RRGIPSTCRIPDSDNFARRERCLVIPVQRTTCLGCREAAEGYHEYAAGRHRHRSFRAHRAKRIARQAVRRATENRRMILRAAQGSDALRGFEWTEAPAVLDRAKIFGERLARLSRCAVSRGRTLVVPGAA